MASIPLTLRDELIDALRSTEKQTEEIFMVLAESLPSLVSEMNRSLDRSRLTIDCMGGTGQGCADGAELGTLLSDIRREMEESSRRFHEMSAADKDLFDQLQVGIDQLNTIATSIDAIRMDSEDMELVSLNAMTVALKAGNAGRAFSYITEELKRLSSRTITLAESISARGTGLLGAFHDLEESLREARDFQNTLISSFEERVFASFDDFQSAVSETVTGLRSLQEESAELRHPVNGLMEAIQLQDLIRQSIDHIILSLEAIRREDELAAETDLLDELAFIRRIPDLAAALMEDVAQQIDQSVNTFFSLIEEAESKRRRLEDDQNRFLTSQSGGAATLAQRFDHAIDTFQDLLSDLDRNVEKKERLVSRSTAIASEVQSLNDQFRHFDTLVTRFHSIDIASRIEVAKQPVLRSMGTTSDQMNELTKQIERDVTASLENTQEFIGSTSSAIAAHQDEFQQQRRFVESFSTSIRDRYRQLQESREEVTETVQRFTLFTTGFHQVFEDTKANGGRLADLAGSLRGLTGTLDRMKEAIEGEYRQQLAARNLSSWTIENTRLQEIIDRFTIFRHKQHAGAVADIDTEDGVEAGEITMF